MAGFIKYATVGLSGGIEATVENTILGKETTFGDFLSSAIISGVSYGILDNVFRGAKRLFGSTAKETIEEVEEQVTKELAQDTSQQAAKELVAETTEQTAKEFAEEAAERTTKDFSDEAVEQATKNNVYNELSGEEHYEALKEIFGEENVEWTSKISLSEYDRLRIQDWGYPPEDDLYIKFKDIYQNELYYNQATGRINWPINDGFADEFPDEIVVGPPKILDRFGGEKGKFLGDPLDSFESRALAPHTNPNDHHFYRLSQETTMRSGKIAPWFGSSGGGTQFIMSHPDGSYYTIEELLEADIIEDITDAVMKGLIKFE